MDKSNVEIEISPGFKINKLPDNFTVIATMNTADRSLAVVDFALRRRFAWYTLKPKAIISNKFYDILNIISPRLICSWQYDLRFWISERLWFSG